MSAAPPSEEGLIKPDPDKALVERAQKELPYDTRSYELLMRQHQQLILRICLKMFGNQHDAEDICQDVMLKIFHHLKSFEGKSSFKTWMSKIATNTCLNAHDKMKRNAEFKRMLSNDPTVPTTSKIKSVQRDLNKIMQLIEPKDRQLLTLRYVAELKIEEISEISGLGLSATKMRLYRAQENLQSQINSATL